MRKYCRYGLVKPTHCILLIIFTTLIITSTSFYDAYAIPPVWSFGSYTLNDGGVQGAGIPSTPVIVSVTDASATGFGTITVRITSSVDPVGFDMTLTEGPPGTFTNANLALMSDNAKASLKSSVTITVFDIVFTTPDPSSVQTLGGFIPILVVSDSDTSGITPTFTETGVDTNLYQARINFAASTNAASNTLAATPGDIFTIVDIPGGNFAHGFIEPNPNIGKGAIFAEVGGTVTATYQGDSSSFSVGSNPGPGRGGGGPIKPGLVVDTPSGGSCNNCQPPTLGIDKNLNRIVQGGFSYNNNPVDVDLFYTSYPLITVSVGQENVAELKIYDDGGVDSIAHVGLAFGLGYGESFSQSKATISLDRTFDGKEIIDVFDPENVLDNVKITTLTSPCGFSTPEQCLVVIIQHMFREELEFNMVGTNVWDNQRNSWQNFYNHGIEVTGDSLNSQKTKLVAFGEKEMRGLYKLTQLDKKKHLWTDEFGNIYEHKGNDRFDRVLSIPQEPFNDKMTAHGCDRNCNWFNEYKSTQEDLAKLTLNKILNGKKIEGEIPKEPFSYYYNMVTRAEDSELQKSIILEEIKAKKILEQLR